MMMMGTLLLNIVLNVLLTSVILGQSFYMIKLSRNYFLDGIRLIQFYRLYFLMTGMCALGIALLSYQNYQKVVFVSLIGVVQLLQAYKPHLEESSASIVDEITNLTENDLLLANSLSNSFPELTQSKSSKPVSLLAINEDNITSKIEHETKRRSSTPKMSSSKSPILALLLGANGAMAMSTTDIPQQSFTSPWEITLIAFIMLSFLSSQLVYSTSIFKTNLYLPTRYQYALFATSALTSSIIIYILCFTSIELCDIIIGFAMLSGPFNLIVPVLLLTQSVTSLVLYRHHSGDLYTNFSTVTIYEGLGSPSLLV